MPKEALIVPRPTVRGSRTVARSWRWRQVGDPISSFESLLDGRCDSCNRMTYPSYTDDAPNGVPELFEINAISRVMTLCTGCLTNLEDAIHAALIDRLMIAEGGSA